MQPDQQIDNKTASAHQDAAAGTLNDRITQAFSDSNGEQYGDKYLDKLHDQMQRVASRSSRLLFELVLLAFVYELFSQSAVTEVSVGIVKLNDLSIIHKMLPVVIAYVYYDYMLAITTYSFMADISRVLFKQMHPAIERYELRRFIEPMHVFSMSHLVHKEAEHLVRRSARVYQVLTFVIAAVVLFAPYLVGAFIVFDLFQRYGTNDFVTWSSVILTAVFLVLAFATQRYLSVRFIPRD